MTTQLWAIHPCFLMYLEIRILHLVVIPCITMQQVQIILQLAISQFTPAILLPIMWLLAINPCMQPAAAMKTPHLVISHFLPTQPDTAMLRQECCRCTTIPQDIAMQHSGRGACIPIIRSPQHCYRDDGYSFDNTFGYSNTAIGNGALSNQFERK